MTDDDIKLISEDNVLSENLDKVVKTDGEVHVSSTSNFEVKVAELKQALSQNKLGCDLKWSIFIAASQSYRFNSCLHPFPPAFVKNENKDFSSLLECLDGIPSLCNLENHLYNKKSSKVVDLLHWILVQQTPCLENIPKRDFDQVLDLVKCDSEASKPNLIFEVKYSNSSSIETNWLKLASEKKRLYAFHGSRLENFHSILHFGLQQHFTKKALFGEGIYLASELGISLIYSPFGLGWNKSAIGSELSIVALCEIIYDPEGVKCQVKNQEDKSYALAAADSIGGEVPQKYYVVQNSNLVKLKYVLVYSRNQASSVIQRSNESKLLSWIRQNKLVCFFLGYFLLLVMIGLSNNTTFQRYYKFYMKKLCSYFSQFPMLDFLFENNM